MRRTEINLHHCSSGETVRGEPAKSVANCCSSVKTVCAEQCERISATSSSKVEQCCLRVCV